MDPNAQYNNNDRGTKKIFTSAQRYFSKCVDFSPIPPCNSAPIMQP